MPAGFWALLIVVVIVLYLIRRTRPVSQLPSSIPAEDIVRKILEDKINFYKNLNGEQRSHFLARTMNFLSGVRITGVGTAVEDIDKVMIGASAIIPIFGFPHWHYTNLHEVLLYPETFGEDFRQKGEGRSVMGMVGNGHMQYVMVLSQHALREGFLNRTDKNNTGIHEFVHLVDKTDGQVDGVPEALVNHQLAAPWLRMMHDQIREISAGKSDINPYGASGDAEFLAVAAEYFFERPDLLEVKHPELFAMLESIFRPPLNNKTPQV